MAHITDWLQAQKIRAQDYYWHALLFALIMGADTDNLTRLRIAFPDEVSEAHARYHARCGVLPSDLQPRWVVLKGLDKEL